MAELRDMLEIAPEKVGHVIVRAREVDVKTEAWDQEGSFDPDDRDPSTILEDLPGDATRQELKEFLDSLNEDEQASLVALAWIGRGTYAPGELMEAIATAKANMLAMPPPIFSASHCCRIIWKMAWTSSASLEDAEADVLGPAQAEPGQAGA